MEATPSRPGPIFWAILGLVLAGAILLAQAVSLGGWSGLLAVGETSVLRPVIEQEIPDLVVTDDPGHDGQVTYVMGLDPWAQWAQNVIPHAGYRYRRILLPALASGFGLIRGHLLLWLLTAVNVLAFAIATASGALIAKARFLNRWAPLAVLLNTGLLLSLQITSPDVVAFACALAGILACLNKRDLLAVAFLGLGALAKETYVLIPLSIAAYLWIIKRDTRQAVVYSASVIPLGLWSALLISRVPKPFETGGNLDWPFFGILDGAQSWVDNSGREIVFLVLAACAIGISALMILRRPQSIWAWLALPWLVLATISSHWIWDFGNNAARAALPLFTFGVFGLVDRAQNRSRSHETVDRVPAGS